MWAWIPAFAGMTAVTGVCALFCACAGRTPTPLQPVVKVPPQPPAPNLEVAVYEVVESPEQDVLARTRIYVDNELASQIDADPKSQEK
jgi:hypothetical protein